MPPPPPANTRSGLPPALMVQGTCSNAGKSLLAAAFCRLLARRGLKVAPFKAQNMALNSFVTDDGKEMGRAQVLQAQACGLAPDVRMNPVLLKPVSHTGSQVIVLGEPVGLMRVAEYVRYKARAWKAVRRAYDSLAAEHDIMVLEGAGSPAEINLRAHDIVNMRMARHAGAAVLLVADIDRGGAFAALAGTLALLGRGDRARVAGFVLNKFRGDAGLLTPALDALRRRTKKPFLGIVPMLEDLFLPEEDSVSLKSGDLAGLPAGPRRHTGEALDILVPDLPHISNATDLDALRQEAGVRLRMVRHREHWGQPHVVILPGSRNTAADLHFLRERGLAELVTAFGRACLAEGRGMLAGICGGLQMLGRDFLDAPGLEQGGKTDALGLLPLRTRLEPAKILRRTRACALPALTDGPDGQEYALAGYEIHHGVTTPDASLEQERISGKMRAVMRDAAGHPLGWGLCDAAGHARVWGSYLHGLFDADGFRHALLARWRKEAGLPACPGAAYGSGPQLDRLADAVEAAVDMPAIYRLLGLESRA